MSNVLRVKELMKLQGINRLELSDKVGVSVTTISNICSEVNMPSIPVLLQIARALDVDVREMFVPTKGSAIAQSEVDEATELIELGLDKLRGL